MFVVSYLDEMFKFRLCLLQHLVAEQPRRQPPCPRRPRAASERQRIPHHPDSPAARHLPTRRRRTSLLRAPQSEAAPAWLMHPLQRLKAPPTQRLRLPAAQHSATRLATAGALRLLPHLPLRAAGAERIQHRMRCEHVALPLSYPELSPQRLAMSR